MKRLQPPDALLDREMHKNAARTSLEKLALLKRPLSWIKVDYGGEWTVLVSEGEDESSYITSKGM